MLEKTFQPADAETRLYEDWERSGAFASNPASNAAPFTIMIPPPNVTGSLHMGHALTFTVQDILIRHARMCGRDALWQPGSDHAGIATQMVVERQLAEQGITRDDLGREAFIEKVWDWRRDSGGTITRQLRRLGASLDWPRERFTMDEGLSHAVRTVFVALYRDGLMYRDKRLVNWDPKLHTAISDLEVEQREEKGSLWYLRYPVEGEPGSFVTVATTRPETMLGDTAVAVHPDDPRYAALVGKRVIVPLVNRPIPVVADSYSDPEKGSGAVKITPAHDFNDFEVGRRHDLPLINVLDRNAHMAGEDVPEAYRGLDRHVARARIVEDLEALGLLERVEEQLMTRPYGDRSGVVIEPWLTDQWFVDAKTLAQPAIAAVEQGRTRFVPESWTKVYFEWMNNIQPWCVSRQIWWGHQIPAWYGPDGTVFVELTEEEAAAAAERHYGKPVVLTRDPDVLDTWFSSALWPFSTLGWPDKTPDLDRYYPGDVLVTGFDIIFFWVARMMMMGLRFMDDVPFRTVYIHALVRDARGQKMSKSKGNVIDPLDLIDRYGCDALRFTLASLAAQGRDIKLAEGRVEGNRNFATKLWNAARYAQLSGCAPVPGFDPAACRQPVNRWIVGEMAACAERVGQAIEEFRFNEAANTAYHFAWGTFCDWYLEFTKPILTGEDAGAQAETRACTAWALDGILAVLHPIMPFLTEELWGRLSEARPQKLIATPWPRWNVNELRDADAAAEMDWVIRLVSDVRAARSELNVPNGAKILLQVRDAGVQTRQRLQAHGELLKRLARLSAVELLDASAPAAGGGVVQLVIEEATFVMPLGDVIDLAAERQRLAREIDRLGGEIRRLDGKLGNSAFVAKAPPDIVEEQRERRQDYLATRERLDTALQRLGPA